MTIQNGINRLQAGTLSWNITRSSQAIETLCQFGVRRSKRRGFVFLSKVLGKHIPVRPAIVLEQQKALAKLLPVFDSAVFVGLAETAIGLGQGVFEAYLTDNPNAKVVFTHTTRHRFDEKPWYSSLESHSHAPDHLGHLLMAEADKIAREAKCLVLIDDEISTGSTLLALAEVLRKKLPNLEKVYFACLTDWSGEEGFSKFESAGITVASISYGNCFFEPDPGYHPEPYPDAIGTCKKLDGQVLRSHGRDGCIKLLNIKAPDPSELGIPYGARILIIGTGEFMHAPLRIGLQWEKDGHDVFFQSSSRSPLAVGDGISGVRSVSDHYGDGAHYYLYNHELAKADWMVVCHETPCPPMIENPGCTISFLRIQEDGTCSLLHS